MHVNQTAQYALRVLMEMAKTPSGTVARAQDLSRTTGVPAAYLSKILRRLAKDGILEARKGHGGGFSLTRRLERIRLMDVLAAVGGALERDQCIFGIGRCDARDPCPLHHSWSGLNDAFHSWSRRTTLRDLQGTALRRRRARHRALPRARAGRGARPW